MSDIIVNQDTRTVSIFDSPRIEDGVMNGVMLANCHRSCLHEIHALVLVNRFFSS